MPTNFDQHIRYWLLDDVAFTLLQRRMLDHGKLNEWILFALGPVTIELFRHLIDVLRLHVTGDHQRRVVRHVIAPLNQLHHLGRRGRNRLTIAQRLFATRVFIEETIVHLFIQIVSWLRLVAIDFADHDLTLALKFLFVKQRISRRVTHEVHRGANVGAGSGEIVFNDFFACLAVISDAELSDALQVLFRVCDGAVGFKEHVLVKVRETVQLRRFGEGTVAHRQLDRHDRH